MEKHHKIARSRFGSDDYWNLEELSEYDHAYKHAVDFVLFPEIAPHFDHRMIGWPLLPGDLQKAVSKAHSKWLSNRHATLGHPQGMLGKTHSEFTKQKMSDNRKGKGPKRLSAETRARMSAAHRGKKWSEAKRAAHPKNYNSNNK